MMKIRISVLFAMVAILLIGASAHAKDNFKDKTSSEVVITKSEKEETSISVRTDSEQTSKKIEKTSSADRQKTEIQPQVTAQSQGFDPFSVTPDVTNLWDVDAFRTGKSNTLNGIDIRPRQKHSIIIK